MSEQVPEPAVEARGLRKTFDDITAVDGLDLVVLPGEVFGLVGPDGAGKTTTMRMLCGALPPTAGSARVLGFDVVTHREEIQRRVGYVPQRFSLYPELTVDENILFRARAYGIGGAVLHDRRERLLALSRLGRFRRRRADALSGGMRQKLALICALIHAPRLLLLDEPTTGVDPMARGEFWELLLGLAAQGVTILAATAYLDEAERCRKVGMLYEGRLLVYGTPHQIRREAGLLMIQVQCQPLADARRAARRVPGLRWAEIFGDRLHAAIEKEDVADALQRALQQAGVTVHSIRGIQPGIEDAFFELVRRRREGRE